MRLSRLKFPDILGIALDVGLGAKAFEGTWFIFDGGGGGSRLDAPIVSLPVETG